MTELIKGVLVHHKQLAGFSVRNGRPCCSFSAGDFDSVADAKKQVGVSTFTCTHRGKPESNQVAVGYFPRDFDKEAVLLRDDDD